MLNPERLSSVLALLDERRRFPVTLLAIDGHSAAGKSSFAHALQQSRSDITIIHTDDFYRPMAEDIRAQLDASGGYDQYYDWQRLETQVLRPMHSGMTARYQRYDWATNAPGVWCEVQPAGVVVVEGCYAARPELRAYYHIIVLVTTSEEERSQRQLQRADEAAWVARWDAAERYYMEHHRPHTYADIIVSGE
ncbi:MAG: hypothetical protein AAGF95_15045 [Chloroflexota bacterium]